MKYTEEEIDCYTNILRNLHDGLGIYTPILENIPLKKTKRISCENCGNKRFFKDCGFRFCNKCFVSIGRVLKEDYTTKDRCHFQKKSIYNRSYHIQNRLDEIIKKYDLNIEPEVYFKVKVDFEKLDRKINLINLKHERKRMINISYLTKKILEKYDKHEADKIELNISDDTLDFYDNWFDTFQAKQ